MAASRHCGSNGLISDQISQHIEGQKERTLQLDSPAEEQQQDSGKLAAERWVSANVKKLRKWAASFAYKTGLDGDVAESTALAEAWKAVQKYTPARGMQLTTYVYQIVRYRLFDALRTQNGSKLAHKLPYHVSLTREVDGVEEFLQLEDTRVKMPEEAIIAAELLHRATRGFTDREKTIFRLRFRDGWKMRAIGDLVGVSETRICQIAPVLRQRARGWLEKDGITASGM